MADYGRAPDWDAKSLIQAGIDFNERKAGELETLASEAFKQHHNAIHEASEFREAAATLRSQLTILADKEAV